MTPVKIKNEYSNSKQYTNAIHFARMAEFDADVERCLVNVLGRIQSMEATLTKKGIRKDHAEWLARAKADLDTLAIKIAEGKLDKSLIGQFEETLENSWTIDIGIGGSKGGRTADPDKVVARLIHDMSLIGIPETTAKDFLSQWYTFE